MKQLLRKVKGGGGGLWWPWTIEHVLTGDMERSYFAYLLEADPHLISVGGKENILILHVSLYAYSGHGLCTILSHPCFV